MKPRSVLALGVIALLLPALSAYAFWSKVFFYVHQNITSTALGKSYSFNNDGKNYTFQLAAITAINDQNGKQDDASNYNALDHFDSERLEDSFIGLWNMRAQLRTLLSASSIDQKTAWQETGRILHLLQDWYSHSSWHAGSSNNIVGGTPDIVDFGLLTAVGTLPIPPSWMTVGANTAVCAPDHVALLSDSTLTTGYYPPASPGANKCSHGELSLLAKVGAATTCAVALTYDPDGIARDHACSHVQAFNADFDRAKLNAVAETGAFVQSVVAELNTTGNGPGFCALLGLSAQPACFITTTVSVTANPSSVDSSGGSVTLTATITPKFTPTGSKGPGGTVTFSDASGPLCSGSQSISGGTVTCSATIASTPDTVTANYSGDTNYAAGTGSVTVMAADLTNAWVGTWSGMFICPSDPPPNTAPWNMVISSAGPGQIEMDYGYPIYPTLSADGSTATLFVSDSGVPTKALVFVLAGNTITLTYNLVTPCQDGSSVTRQ